MINLRRYTRRPALVLAALMALVLVAPGQYASANKGANPGVLPPQSKPYGHSYGEWSNSWWQWAFSNPVILGQEEDNPLFDTTGINCGVNQSGPVFYLAGIFSVLPSSSPAVDPLVRTECVVPTGKALFFPILNVEDDNSYDPSRTEEDIRQFVADNLALAENMSASIDGNEVENLEEYFVGADNVAASVTMPANNLYQYYGVPVAPGTYYPMVTGGYYIMLSPLSRGEHTIHFEGAFGEVFSLDITYELTVR